MNKTKNEEKQLEHAALGPKQCGQGCSTPSRNKKLPWRHRFRVKNYVDDVNVRNKERYGEGKELHDQRPALTPVGHGEQNILTRLTMCFATRMDLTLRAKSNKTESQKPTSWPYSEQDVLSIWLPDQQDAVTMASTDVLDAAQ